MKKHIKGETLTSTVYNETSELDDFKFAAPTGGVYSIRAIINSSIRHIKNIKYPSKKNIDSHNDSISKFLQQTSNIDKIREDRIRKFAAQQGLDKFGAWLVWMNEQIRILPNQLLRIVRLKHPSTIRGEIFSEFPMKACKNMRYIKPRINRKKTKIDPKNWNYVQEIRIFDPRNIIDGCFGPSEKGDKVRIERMLVRRAKKPEEGYRMISEKRLEIIKEYTFEEWDAGVSKENIKGL